MKVFINPGHMPGVDSGATNPNSGLRECDVALAVAKLVEYYLKNADCEVMRLQSDNLNGESSAYPNVCRTANEWGADVFVSLHCNAFDGYARGIETLMFNFGSEAERLAACVHKQLVDTEQSIDPYIPDRGLKERPNLSVLRNTDMPAILIEMGFIDNDHDVILLEHKQDAIAKAIARGVTDYANL
jgi:N-acetylmuramoyl-L-alanine amidase